MADAEGEFAGADVPRTTDYIVGPLANALDILLEFEGGQSELRVADMARRVGLTRNKAFRLVKTLESRGFLQRIGEHYRLGARLLALGELAARSIGVLSVAAQPEMETLARETGETVYLLVPDGNEVVCVAVIESEHYVRISPAIGQRRPLHAGAGQKMLFAGMEDQRIEQVLRQAVQPFTPSTITDAAALRRRLADIRQRGHSRSLGEVDADAGAVAAAIHDDVGQMVAAIVVGGAMSRAKIHLDSEWTPLVVAAAGRISARLGHQAAATE